MRLSDGTTLQGGKYRIERFLGQGGFGITYLAYESGLKRQVVIKEFFIKDFCYRDSNTSQVTVSSEGGRQAVDHFRKKFIREAQTIAGLEHPHIIPIYDKFEENGTAYYVMKYLSGGSLADKLKERLPSPLTEKDVVRYLSQVADALAYVHAHNKMHLDVKPGNIMLSDKGEAVLIDFGLVKQYDEEGEEICTTTLGGFSPRFSPLEQINCSGMLEFLPATDIYALGATFYNLLVGQYPPDAADINENGLPPLPKHISPAVAAAIEKAMQPKRKDRPQTIEEFLKLLEEKPASTNGKTKVREEKKEPKVNVKPEEEKKKEEEIIDVEIIEEFPPEPKPEKPVTPEKPSGKKPLFRLSNFWIGVLLIPVLTAIGLWSESLLFDEYVSLWRPSDGGFLPFLLWPFLLVACLYGRNYVKKHQPKFWGRFGLFLRLFFGLAFIAAGGCLWRFAYLNEWREVPPTIDQDGEADAVVKETVTVNGFNFKMVAVEGGTFQMGQTSEQNYSSYHAKPIHSVTLSNYAISETEVTQGLWKAVMGNNPSHFKGDNKPVESVSWNECQEFIRKLNSLTGRRFRLPTEAEWEFAARGGRNSVGFRYAGGDDMRKVGIYNESIGNETYPVKSKLPNELGFYDMSGNVREWCADWYGEYPPYSQTNPTGPSFGSHRVFRGGHWNTDLYYCSISDRNWTTPSYSDKFTGFRLAE